MLLLVVWYIFIYSFIICILNLSQQIFDIFNQNVTFSYKVADEEILPPPPPIPTDIEQFKQLRRADTNAIGSMTSYLEMQKRKRDQKAAEKSVLNDSNHVNEVNGETIIENPAVNMLTLAAGMSFHTYVEGK